MTSHYHVLSKQQHLSSLFRDHLPGKDASKKGHVIIKGYLNQLHKGYTLSRSPRQRSSHQGNLWQWASPKKGSLPNRDAPIKRHPEKGTTGTHKGHIPSWGTTITGHPIMGHHHQSSTSIKNHLYSGNTFIWRHSVSLYLTVPHCYDMRFHCINALPSVTDYNAATKYIHTLFI